jgi:hypothetical protein
MPTWTNPEDCLSELVQLLHAWWQAARGHADVPDRADLHPEEMKRLLPFMFIADAEHDPFRVRYRLVGTKAVEITGFDITGHYLDELLSAEPDQPWMDHYQHSYVTRAPLLGATTVPTTLRNGGTSIEQFVAVEDYFGLSAKIVLAEPWRAKTVGAT